MHPLGVCSQACTAHEHTHELVLARTCTCPACRQDPDPYPRAHCVCAYAAQTRAPSTCVRRVSHTVPSTAPNTEESLRHCAEHCRRDMEGGGQRGIPGPYRPQRARLLHHAGHHRLWRQQAIQLLLLCKCCWHEPRQAVYVCVNACMCEAPGQPACLAHAHPWRTGAMLDARRALPCRRWSWTC